MPIASLRDIETLEETTAEAVWARGSVYEQIARVAERSPERVAIRALQSGAADTPVETVTYGALLRRIHAMAHLFRQCGVGPGDAVSMLLATVPDAFAAMIGAHLVGRANPVNFLLEPAHIAALLKAAKAKVLLVPDASVLPGIIDKLPAILAALDAPLHVFRVGDSRAGQMMPFAPSTTPCRASRRPGRISGARRRPMISRPSSTRAERPARRSSRCTPMAASRTIAGRWDRPGARAKTRSCSTACRPFMSVAAMRRV